MRLVVVIPRVLCKYFLGSRKTEVAVLPEQVMLFQALPRDKELVQLRLESNGNSLSRILFARVMLLL